MKAPRTFLFDIYSSYFNQAFCQQVEADDEADDDTERNITFDDKVNCDISSGAVPVTQVVSIIFFVHILFA